MTHRQSCSPLVGIKEGGGMLLGDGGMQESDLWRFRLVNYRRHIWSRRMSIPPYPCPCSNAEAVESTLPASASHR